MTRRSSAVARCESELRAIGIRRGFESLDPLTETESRLLECFDRLVKDLTIAELHELECLIHYIRRYWIEGMAE